MLKIINLYLKMILPCFSKKKMVLSYDFERLMMGQQTTDTDFKHFIDFDDNLLF